MVPFGGVASYSRLVIVNSRGPAKCFIIKGVSLKPELEIDTDI